MPTPRLFLALAALVGLSGCTRVLQVADAVRAQLPRQADAGPCTGLQLLPNGAENLGTCVNSAYAELVPIVSPDGRSLYFVRKESPDNVGGAAAGDDIWTSRLGPDGAWGRAENIGAPLNTARNNYVVTAMPGGNALVLANIYNRDGTGSSGVSVTRRTATGWAFPEALRLTNLVNRNAYGSYAMAGDGRTLLLAVQGDDSRGDQDLYVSFVQPDGSWSQPRNLGPTLNTAQAETTPFLAADGTTLYFSSLGHGGEGGYDVFVTRRLDDSWTRWSAPENLGPTVNSAGGELGFNIPASGDLAYLASTTQSVGLTDIVRVAVPAVARPRAVALVSGRVLAAGTGAPLGATVTYEALDGSARGTANTDPATGAYTIALPAGAVYGFRGEAAGHYAESTTLDLSATTAYEERQQDLSLTPLAVGTTLRLNNLFFDTGRATLRPESGAELDRLAAFLAANPAVEVEIAGHTDSEGSDATNQTLSQGRAQAVVAYLTARGVAAARTPARGYGEARPAGTNDTPDGRQANRRVEFRVTRL